MPDTVEVKTGEQEATDESDSIKSSLSFLNILLLVFAGIAVFVGAFIIFNTFSITVAQRTREFALLRTMGASRRQVLRSVMLEALIVGLIASILGLLLGIVTAQGINALFKAFGADLPQEGLVLKPRTVIVALLVGTVVTMLASLAPARRATRVPPLAAMREEAATPQPPTLLPHDPVVGSAHRRSGCRPARALRRAARPVRRSACWGSGRSSSSSQWRC